MNFFQLSVHGLYLAMFAKKLWMRILFVIGFIAAISAIVASLTMLIPRLISQPNTVTTNLITGPVPFPAVTICNLYSYARRFFGSIPEFAALQMAYDNKLAEMAASRQRRRTERVDVTMIHDENKQEISTVAQEPLRVKRQAACPAGWYDGVEACYKLFPDSQSHAAAESTCQNESAMLIAAHSNDSWTNMKADITAMGYGGLWPWMAITDTAQEGYWRALDNNGVYCGAKFLIWNPGEPNNWGEEDCVAGALGGPFDVLCSAITNTICIIPKTDYCINSLCPDGWLSTGDNCWLRISDAVYDSANAKIACAALGQDVTLPSIKDAATLAEFRIAKNALGYSGYHPINGFREYSISKFLPNQYKVVSNLETLDSCYMPFTRWGPSQPSFTLSENQVYILGSEDEFENKNDTLVTEIFCHKHSWDICSCPTNWISKPDACYYDHGAIAQFPTPITTCENLDPNSFVPFFRNGTDFDHFMDVVNAGSPNVWTSLAGRDTGHNGDYTIWWRDGAEYPMMWVNWATGEPNLASEHFIGRFTVDGFGDFGTGHWMYTICQIPLFRPLGCPYGWTMTPNNICYQHIGVRDLGAGLAACQSLDHRATLPVFVDAFEHAEFVNFTIPYAPVTKVTLGISDEREEGLWEHTQADHKYCPVPWLNWAPSKPAAGDFAYLDVADYNWQMDDGDAWAMDVVCQLRLDGPYCGTQMCPDPPGDIHGYFTRPFVSGALIGDVTTFHCRSGYELAGTPNLTCLSDLTYDDSFPQCATNCPTPTLANGSVTVSRAPFVLGENASFSCNDTHHLIGNSVVGCLLNGTLDSNIPHCAETCSTPSLLNGNVTTNSTPIFVGAEVNFSCAVNFYLVGNQSATCLSGNRFETPIPDCKALCVPPTAISGGYFSTGTTPVYEGVVVTYGCNAFFYLSGCAQRTCLANGTYDCPTPMCSPVSTTTSLPDSGHGGGSGTSVCNPPSPINNGYLDDGTAPVYQGSIVTYGCDSGYNLIGCPQRICMSGGLYDCPSPICSNGSVVQVGNVENRSSSEGNINQCASHPCSEHCFDYNNGFTCVSSDLLSWATSEISKRAMFDTNVSPFTTEAFNDLVEDISPYIFQRAAPQTRRFLSDQLNQMISSCSFNGLKCNWTKSELTTNGECLTTNNYMYNRISAQRSGKEKSLKLRLNPDEPADLSGIRLSFHSPNRNPFPSVDGFNIAPGIINQFRLEYTELRRLSTPNAKCVDTPGIFPDPYYYNDNYTEIGCRSSFLQQTIVRECGCASPKYPLPNKKVPYCDLAKKNCADEYEMNATVRSDQCYEPCWSEIFEATVTKVSKTPRSQKMAGKCEVQESTANNDETHIVLMYKKMQWISLVESAGYSVNGFM